jgi:hypothetical protein
MSGRGAGVSVRGLIAIISVAIFASSGCGGGSEGPGDNAHVNEDSGSTNGLLVDERTGTPPPAPVPVPKGKSLYAIARDASCFLQVNLPPKEGKPVPPSADPPEYKTDPPVSGPYVEPPNQQADGAYMNMPDAIDQLGALNHGRMIIQYAPDLSDKAQLEIKGLYDTMYGAALLFPNDEMPFAVAATTWGNLLACTSYDTQKTADAIRTFGKETWGKHGGEPVDAFPFEGPTPADPEEAGSPE